MLDCEAFVVLLAVLLRTAIIAELHYYASQANSREHHASPPALLKLITAHVAGLAEQAQ